jgi:hypothetical protein
MTAYELGVKSAADNVNGFIAGPVAGATIGGLGGLALSPLYALAKALQKIKEDKDQAELEGRGRRPVRSALKGGLQGLVGAPLIGAATGGALGLGVGGSAELANRLLQHTPKQP